MKNSLLLALIVVSFVCIRSHAANIYYLPEDAFFPTELTAEQLAELRKGDPKKYTFQHSSYETLNSFFCGSAGHYSVQLDSLDEKFVEQMIVAYKQVRKRYAKQYIEETVEGKIVLKESNPIRILFYPAEFDYPTYQLGLQYNENWAEETKKFGHTRGHIRYLSLVDDKAAIIESWQHSKEVGSFKFALPAIERDPESGFSNPIILKGALKAIVVPAFPLKDFVYGDKIDEVRIVEQDGVYQYKSKENEDGLPEMVKFKAK